MLSSFQNKNIHFFRYDILKIGGVKMKKMKRHVI